MVIDSSALIAILQREPEAEQFTFAIAQAELRLIAAPVLLEATMVAAARAGTKGITVVRGLIRNSRIEVVAFDATLADRGILAFLTYGKGRHPASLNFGDCCSYALAASRGLPLLFKGSDFSRTDIRSARPA